VEDSGKRVSWVELYLDLIFVLAVGRLAHLIVAEPEAASVWKALGLFVTLWWTWIGFAVLYNRLGADAPAQRLLFLAGSVPMGVAAVALDPASEGDSTVFAVSMAVTRLVLAGAHGGGGGPRDLLRARIARAYALSALLFLVSLALPGPWRYVLWAIAIAAESGALLEDDREASRHLRQRGGRTAEALQAMAPTRPGEALDPHHFAERFGLFLIILLGEVVVEAGAGSVHVDTTGGWAALVASMILAGALWWLYFDSAADINLRVLELSGGSPTIARTIFAVGHMLPAFSLLMIAAGVGLMLEQDTPHIAYSLASLGLGIYLLGTRVFLRAGKRISGAARALLLVATFFLPRLDLEPYAFLWLLAGWAVMCAGLSTRGGRVDVEAELGERRGRDSNPRSA
jgi:low temperature requirement protein LtrA